MCLCPSVPPTSSLSPSPPLPQRVVLVTGAAQRLGRCIALALAREGWRVAVHYRHSAVQAQESAALCAELAGDSACFAADFAQESAVRGLLDQVLARWGRVDAVVNSAALFEYDAVTPHDDAPSGASFSYEGLTQHLHSNTAAPVLLAQALHRHIVQRQAAGDGQAQGVVVNLLDQKLCNPNPDFFSYTLSKAALQAAGTMLALALAPALRVVGVAPGLTLTSQTLSPERFAQLHQMSPLGRSSSPEEVASAVRFALDNRALTGTTLLVDGGQHLQHFARDFSFM